MERSEIRSPECLWRYADLEGGLVELGYRQACAVDRYAVTEMRISQDLVRTVDRERGSAATARGFIMLFES